MKSGASNRRRKAAAKPLSGATSARASKRAGKRGPRAVEKAAVEFRESMIGRADAMLHGTYPLWHGWALYDAFKAGARWATPIKPTKRRKEGKT